MKYYFLSFSKFYGVCIGIRLFMNSVNLDLFVSLPSGVDVGFVGVFVVAAIVTGGCGVVGEAMSEIKVK